MGDYRVTEVFGAVHNLTVAVLLLNSFIDMFMKGISPLELKIARCNSKPVPTLIIITLSEKPKNRDKDKAHDALIIERDSLSVLRVARQKKTWPRSEGIVFVATDARGVVEIEPRLE